MCIAQQIIFLQKQNFGFSVEKLTFKFKTPERQYVILVIEKLTFGDIKPDKPKITCAAKVYEIIVPF
jgi:hypothetical protein